MKTIQFTNEAAVIYHFTDGVRIEILFTPTSQELHLLDDGALKLFRTFKPTEDLSPDALKELLREIGYEIKDTTNETT